VAARNSIDLETDPRSIVGTRVFDAPRELVFAAWTEPQHLSQWWGPDGFTTTTHAFEFRAGGVWRFVMHGPDGRDYENRITFDEIVPPERIVYHHGGGGDVEPVQFNDRHLRGSGWRQDPAHHAWRVPVGTGTRPGDRGVRRRQGPRANARASRWLRGKDGGTQRLTLAKNGPVNGK
jgi:uncharacterized protein YndB with AHSA1/START domain